VIAASAGHRVHLESDDPSLEGLRCVECHSTSVHEFASVDRTCAQSGCHTESGVELGAMSDLTIHCVACHGFSNPTPGDASFETFSEALEPDRDTCLSCHEMRLLVSMPQPDPHEGSCASCHNPHTQASPAEAVESCATAGCHESLEALTPFHVGLDDSVASDCLYCHVAHDFRVDGQDCLACHQAIRDDDPTVPRPATVPGSGAPSAALSGAGSGARFASLVLHGGSNATPAAGAPVQVDTTFRHSQHVDFSCAACHDSARRHGEPTVTAPQGCRDCHHTPPASNDCGACHATSGSTGDPYAFGQTFTLPVSGTFDRSLPFEHALHVAEPCSTCHTDGPARSPQSLDCASCHEEHHAPETTCASCHAAAPASVHPVAEAHVTCSSAGCHTDGPFPVAPRTRTSCLACHQDMVDHRPEQPSCAECHALPAPRGGGR
jgi:hypothetical protein